jgi:eukaryotic-like serine/threonine-protein kinase
LNELLPNSTLSHYRILSKIGEGGMGEVYLAEDTRLDRKVALKILPAEVASDPKRMQRFVQEAKAASALNHPNIITIYEIDQKNSVHFIATEFIDGETLRQRNRHNRYNSAEALEVAIQIASALAAAHEAGIVHRDIKPDNVMLRRDGIAKVLDFGLAKLTAPETSDPESPTRKLIKTESGVVMGTAIYMSPEQARGMTLDARTDIFSLGVVTYELIAGCLPFEGSTTSDVLASILNEQGPPPLARFARNVPAELERIVEKALRKNREERYQNTRDMMLDLRRLKQKLEVEAEIERTVPPEMRESAHKGKDFGDDKSVTFGARSTTSGFSNVTATIKSHPTVVLILSAGVLISLVALSYYFYSRRVANHQAFNSIAVLPLINTSNDPNTDYLAEGISEALINSLTELPQLRVVARSTAFRYKGKDVDPQTVGRELNVRAVLMGRVRQIGDALNVQVDLVDATTGAQLWGKNYERKFADVLSVKQAIAREVTEHLKLEVSGEKQRQLARRDTSNAEAYQLYLRGRFHWNKRTGKDLEKSVEYFRQAVIVDPNYALGYAGLADGYTQFSQFSNVPSRELMPKAKEAAEKALSLDDGLAEAHAALGLILFLYDYDFRKAEVEFKRAIELNPNYGSAHHFYARLLTALGRDVESFAEIRRALEIDPLALPFNWFYGHALYFARRYDEAIAQLKKTVELDAGFPGAHYWLARVHQANRNYASCVDEYAKALELEGSQQLAQSVKESFAKDGWKGFLRTSVQHVLSPSYNRVIYYAELGEKDRAFTELNKLYENRAPFVMYVRGDPRLDPLRDDSRFQDLLKKVGFSG